MHHPTMKETIEDPVDIAVTAFTRNRDDTANRRDAFKAFYQNYRQMYPDDATDAEYTNNYFDPITMETVSTYTPFICSRPPNLKMRPREETDILPADRIRNWQDYQWYVQKMAAKRMDLAWYCGVFGTAVLYHFYHKEVRKQKFKKFTQSGVKWVEREVNWYDDPDTEVVDIVNDFFPDSFGTSVDTCHNIVLRQYVSVDDIKRLSDGDDPWYTESVTAQDLIDSILTGDYSLRKSNYERHKDNKFVRLSEMGVVETLSYWEDDRLIIVANREHLLRDTPNPYHFKKKPFTVFVDEHNPVEIWGIGEAEILVKVQHVLNTVGRMHIDAAKRQLRQIFLAPIQSGLDPGAAYDEQNYVIESNQTSAVVPLPPPIMSNAGIPTMMELRTSADRATGFTPLFKGMSGPGADTATEKRLEQGNMMARAFSKLAKFDAGFAEWMMKNIALALQYYPEEKFFRVVNKRGVEWKKLNYNDLLAGVDVEIESRSSQPISIDEKTLQADSLLATYSQNPYVRQRELTVASLEMKEIPDYERFVKTDEELQAEMQQQAQMMEQEKEDAYNKEISREVLRSMMAQPEEEVTNESVG